MRQSIQKHHFVLNVNQDSQGLYILMKMLVPTVTTSSMPATKSFLLQHVPSVLNTVCHNPDGLSFKEEVEATELGHLLEHLLLDLTQKEVWKSLHHKPHFQGETTWDWDRDGEGVFHIRLKIPNKYKAYFDVALHQAVQVVSQILETADISAKASRTHYLL